MDEYFSTNAHNQSQSIEDIMQQAEQYAAQISQTKDGAKKFFEILEKHLQKKSPKK